MDGWQDMHQRVQIIHQQKADRFFRLTLCHHVSPQILPGMEIVQARVRGLLSKCIASCLPGGVDQSAPGVVRHGTPSKAW